VITGTACYKAVLIFRGLLLPLLPHCTKVAVLHFVTNNASLWAGAQCNCLVPNAFGRNSDPSDSTNGNIFIHHVAERAWLTASGV